MDVRRLCPYAFQHCKLADGCTLSRELMLANAPMGPALEQPLEGLYATRFPKDRRERVTAAAKRCKYAGDVADPKLYHTRRARPQAPAAMSM